jgi:hypothetical protein
MGSLRSLRHKPSKPEPPPNPPQEDLNSLLVRTTKIVKLRGNLAELVVDIQHKTGEVQTLRSEHMIWRALAVIALCVLALQPTLGYDKTWQFSIACATVSVFLFAGMKGYLLYLKQKDLRKKKAILHTLELDLQKSTP